MSRKSEALIRIGRRLAPLQILVAALLCPLCLLPAPALAVSEEDWLGRVNEIRQGSQLPPVSENSSWSAGIYAHLRYLALTGSEYRTGEYASAHTENPASPYYTEEGDREARHSDLTSGSTSNLDAINSWLTAPFHAIGILRPGLQQVAFAREAPGGGAGLDVLSGFTYSESPRLVLFPGPGATIDLPRFGGESPDPIETCEGQHPGADYSRAGLPLIALLTEPPEPGAGATLVQPNGVQVSTSGSDLCIITEHNFTTSDGVYGPAARSILESDMAVVVIPREPLVAGTYRVAITQPGREDVAWSFNSSPPVEAEPTRASGGPVRVRFGRPHFRRRFVSVWIDNSRGAEGVDCRVFSARSGGREIYVSQGSTRLFKARIHRHGRSRVSVRTQERLLARRTFYGPRSHRRRR